MSAITAGSSKQAATVARHARVRSQLKSETTIEPLRYSASRRNVSRDAAPSPNRIESTMIFEANGATCLNSRNTNGEPPRHHSMAGTSRFKELVIADAMRNAQLECAASATPSLQTC